MTHVRQQIREAAATALSGATVAGTKVYSSLTYPSDVDTLPIVHVKCDEEESELAAVGGSRLMARTANLVITGAQKSTDETTLDNALDSIAAEIEAVIGYDDLGGVAKQNILTATLVQRSSEGNQAIGEISLTFQVVYHTDATDAEVAL